MPENPQRHTRRFAAVALFALLLGLAWFSGFRPAVEAHDTKHAAGNTAALGSMEAVSQDAGDVAKGARGVKDSAATDAANKLRSLLKVREGEVAFISLPTESVACFIDSSMPVPDEMNHVIFMPHVTRAWLEEKLAAAKGSDSRIRGQVQEMRETEVGKALHWANERWKVEAEVLTDGHSDTLMLQIAEEGRETVVATGTIPRGNLLLLLSSTPEPEGLVIFLGGEPEVPSGEEAE